MEVTASTADAAASDNPARKIRVWPAVVLLAVFGAFLIGNHWLEMAMFTRFVSRFVALGLWLLLFLAWWLTNRGVSLRDRFLALGVFVLSWIAAGLLAHETVGLFGVLISGLPFVFTAWVLWIVLSRRLSSTVQRAGFCLVMLLTFGYFALLRWDGLDGAQRSQTSWRWTPTAEELYLQTVNDQPKISTADSAQEAWTLQPGDWPEFRGANRDGVVTGVILPTDWDENPPKELWRRRVGPGWSSAVVVDGHLVTQEQRDDREAVVCYDAATGKEVWVHEDEVRFTETLSGTGPRGTPTFSDGRISTLGAKLTLNCLEAATGQRLWSHDLVSEAGGEVPQWGYATSPLVVDGMVIAYAGGKDGKGLVAYRVDDGEVVWSRPGGTATFSSPQLVTLLGERQLLMHHNHALVAVNPADGTLLWKRPTGSEIAQPMIQTHVVGDDKLLIPSDLPSDPGIVLIEVKNAGGKWTVADVWKSNRLKPGFNDFVVHEGHIYGLDDGILCCLDVESGERLWKKGRYGHGQVLLIADQNALLVTGEMGDVALVSASPKRHEELTRFQAIEGKTWNHPVIAHGRMYVRNGEEMVCYEVLREPETTVARRGG